MKGILQVRGREELFESVEGCSFDHYQAFAPVACFRLGLGPMWFTRFWSKKRDAAISPEFTLAKSGQEPIRSVLMRNRHTQYVPETFLKDLTPEAFDDLAEQLEMWLAACPGDPPLRIAVAGAAEGLGDGRRRRSAEIAR